MQQKLVYMQCCKFLLTYYKVPNVFREESVRSLPSKIKRNRENSSTLGARPENNATNISYPVACTCYIYSYI